MSTTYKQSHRLFFCFTSVFDNLHLFEDRIASTSFYHYTDALNREGRYDETIQFYMGLSELLKAKAGMLTTLEVMIALIHNRRTKEVWDIIEKNDNHSFSCSNVGPNTVTVNVTDVNGNTGTQTAIITIQDNVAPLAICQDRTVQLDINGNWVYNYKTT